MWPARRLATVSFVVLAFVAGCVEPIEVRTSGALGVEAIGELGVHASMNNLADPLELRPLDGCLGCGAVAIIDVDGLLVDQPAVGLGSMAENPVALFHEKVTRAADDPRVVAIVLRIDSPGGGVTASDLMRRELLEAKRRSGKPTVACLLDLGTGGAYYLATAADAIVAQPTSVTGGVGVVLNLYSLEDAMLAFSVIGVPIKAGERIDLGTNVSRMDQEGRDILQAIADEFHDRFRNVVRENRPNLSLSDDELDGRIFSAQQAFEKGMVDRVAYLEDAIDWARELAGAPGAVAALYRRPNDRSLSIYDVTPNLPLERSIVPVSLPGLERSRLPTFLYLWQTDPTLEHVVGP